jgi:hypothetical protein
MSNTLDVSPAPEKPRSKYARRFPAQVGRYDDPAQCATIDRLVDWIEDEYREDLTQRPSKHVYIRKLPADVIAQIDELRQAEVIHRAILSQFEPDSVIVPMQHTDELYISHYNKDRGGDQGLYSKHYDGNLRFLPWASVVRSLIYLQSDATYTVVFGDSQVSKAFTSYEFGILDFHRELHWVEGEYNPDDQQRILLKCNYMVIPPNAGLVGRAVLGANTGVFYVVKAAMEYSKSPKTPVQHVVGWACNVFRVANNVHPFVPFAMIGLAIAGLGWGLAHWLL